jgi:predicted GNAT superfamily acetyltransferase
VTSAPRADADPMAEVFAMAAACGIELRPVVTAAGHHAVAELFARVWQAPGAEGPVRAGTMRAAQHVGAYAVGAHTTSGPEVGSMVAASFGFHGHDGHLHSHVTGVLADWQGRGLGRIMKLHQRAWCLARGVDTVTWTFDPLVRRNAWFNLRSLGAEVTEYLPSFYGPMTDGINAGDDTDRVFVVWRLASDGVRRALAGEPRPPRAHGAAHAPGHATTGFDAAPAVVVDRDGVPASREAPADARAVRVALPDDIEAIRADDADVGRAWRHAVRDAIVARLAEGWRITTITTDGSYLLEAP